jgi:hypothetical protein
MEVFNIALEQLFLPKKPCQSDIDCAKLADQAAEDRQIQMTGFIRRRIN